MVYCCAAESHNTQDVNWADHLNHLDHIWLCRYTIANITSTHIPMMSKHETVKILLNVMLLLFHNLCRLQKGCHWIDILN